MGWDGRRRASQTGDLSQPLDVPGRELALASVTQAVPPVVINLFKHLYGVPRFE